jgi:hypothetical protein
MCANQTCSSTLAAPAPTLDGWKRSGFMKAMIVVVEAFQEALDMRRAAQRRYFLSDE